jgi:hypothetical protein
MRMEINRVNVWAADILDQPGALAEKLEVLAQADIDLEFINARRAHDKPGHGVVYVLPIKGAHKIRAARKAGFEITKSLHGVSIATGNKPGFSSELARRLAMAGINLRAFSGASINNQAIFYLAFDSDADANKAIQLLKE